MNGGCERMIRTAKECLSLLTKKVQSLLELNRRFGNIEFIMNQRPVIQKDEKWYSPFELTQGWKFILSTTTKSIDPISNYMFCSKHTKEVTKLWMTQYLQKLSRISPAEATKISVGDWVILPKAWSNRME